jgi:Heterokaryon incompatibility protein (HET)
MTTNFSGFSQKAVAKVRSTFKYQPLEHPTSIRIVVLQHGFGNDPIECCLLHTELGKNPYEALSYEWGSPTYNDPAIVLNDCDVRVRVNLRDALTKIRLEEEDRYI